jgi:hypothetical protein
MVVSLSLQMGGDFANSDCASQMRQSSGESDEDYLRHLQLSIAQCRILQECDVFLSQSRRHDPVYPQQEASAEDHVIKDDLLDQSKDFSKREDNIDSLVAFAESLHAVDVTPAQKRVNLYGDEIGYKE